MSGVLAQPAADLSSQTTAFLNHCRVEKGLCSNSLSAYASDLAKFRGFIGQPEVLPGTEGIRHYLDHLYKSGLSHRSIGRHLTTLRTFYGFLLREGRIATDP